MAIKNERTIKRTFKKKLSYIKCKYIKRKHRYNVADWVCEKCDEPNHQRIEERELYTDIKIENNRVI